MLTIREATEDDLEYLIPRIRMADRNEVAVAGGRTIGQTLPIALKLSRVCEVLVNDENNPVAIYGVTDGQPPPPYTTPFGVVWLLATDDIEGKDRLAFVRISRDLVSRVMLPRYAMLHNYCWHGNYHALRWLMWCGFTLLHPVRLGPMNQSFFPFFLRNKNPCVIPSQ